MDDTYLHQQNLDQPLFDNVLWSRPERKNAAGKLVIIGGNAHGFSSVSESFSAAANAGIGVARVMMPDSLSKTIGKVWPESEFAPSTKSGGFSLKALSDLMAVSSWSDGALVCGDLGANSETAIVLDRLVEKSETTIALTGDAINLMSSTPLTLLEKDNLIIGPDFTQFQKLLTSIRYPTALKSSLNMFQVADLLHSLTLNYKFSIVFIFEGYTYVAHRGEVSTTPAPNNSLLAATTACTVWRLQQPTKPYEAMTTAVFSLYRSAGL